MSRRKRERNGLSGDKAAVTGLGLSEVGTRTLLSATGRDASLDERGFCPHQYKGEIRMSQNIEPSNRRRLVIGVFAFALVCLIVFGIMARNGWLPHTDAVTGKRTGWFGQPVSEPGAIATGSNPNAPLPSGTPQLSKEYIYAGSRLLAVEDANAAAAPPADLAVWRPTNGYFYVLGGTGSAQVFVPWGTSGDTPVQGDFDGDGKTDFSVFRPPVQSSPAVWWIMKSSTLDTEYYSVPFGATDDVPAQADFDGDGKTDVAVWRPSTGVWYIIASSTGATQYATYGANGDKPAPADYDGDGRADLALWRSTNNTFYSINSSNNGLNQFTFTQTSTEPVSADYDGDGRADYAIRNGNNWIIRNSSNPATPVTTAWQLGTDIAVQNDYDGDGKVDIATWRGSNGTWYIRQSASVGTANELRQVQWGMSGDIPVPAFYRR